MSDDSAFPIIKSEPCYEGAPYTHITQGGGLTKRELFAAMAMQGVIASYTTLAPPRGSAARLAVEFADALLAELAKERP